jgi:hypothetical protein
MKRLLVLGMVLVLAATAHAERIKASILFEVAGYAGLAKDAQALASNQATATMQKALAQNLAVADLASGPGDSGFLLSLKGDWRSKNGVREAAEMIRTAALAACESVSVAKTSIASFRIEVEDGGGRGKDDADSNLRARVEPRLDLEMKDKMIAELTIIDVPLVRVMERLGKHTPLTYLMHPEVTGRPVFLRLTNVTLDEALTAIATSAGVDVQRREKYVELSRPK